jgi:hypothetical protein
LEEDVSRPLLEEKCMMATVSGTNVQMEMVSPTHKCIMEMVSWTAGLINASWKWSPEEKQRYRGPKCR